MISLLNADKVLKDIYLTAVSEEMNKSNPFYTAIQKGSENIEGRRAVLACRYGVNGGIASRPETESLPTASINNFANFTLDLANIYGVIEISDKAVRASESNQGAMINLLNYQMESLLDSAKFNFNRMLWQDGSGIIGRARGTNSAALTINVHNAANFREGMILDVFNQTTNNPRILGVRVVSVNRDARSVTFETPSGSGFAANENDFFTLQGSRNNEILGLAHLFSTTATNLYGMDRASFPHLLPIRVNNEGGALTADAIQSAIDRIEEKVDNAPNMILTNFATRRKYLNHLQTTRTNIDFLNLDGGFKAISYSGIPVIADRFCHEDAMFFLNTDDFKLVQLCDWEWIEGDNGRILTQVPNRAAYSATLVKYANLGCTKPFAQAKLTNFA